jgi:DNA modification methylase
VDGEIMNDIFSLNTKQTVYCGDSLEVMKTMPDNSVDSVVTDPPYGLSQHSQKDIENALDAWLKGEEYIHGKKGFMGKSWDSFVPSPTFWKECYRVLKPGAHVAVFAGARTQDLMGIALRLAGFEIRDTIIYAFGSGFPKSLSIGKAIDREAGVEREVIGYKDSDRPNVVGKSSQSLSEPYTRHTITEPVTDEAKEWSKYGSSLKPAFEPIIIARKPLSEKTIAQNVLKWRTGAINIDDCRVESSEITGWGGSPSKGYSGGLDNEQEPRPVLGRFPANLILEADCEEVEVCFPNVHGAGHKKARDNRENTSKSWKNSSETYTGGHRFGDSGSASRFFNQFTHDEEDIAFSKRILYFPKASKKDRNEGLEGLEAKQYSYDGRNTPIENPFQRNNSKAQNFHPTVKSTPLLRHLCRLITPNGGLIYDPFLGSGSTGKAAKAEGFDFIGSEIDKDYCFIAVYRMGLTEDDIIYIP